MRILVMGIGVQTRYLKILRAVWETQKVKLKI